jgi:HEAT repeat protein
MNQLLTWLAEGDLRSDGLSDEVVNIVLQQPNLITELIEGLEHDDDSVRGHTADALEKIGRIYPDILLPYLPRLLISSKQDPVAMVRMHMAMIFGHVVMYKEHVNELVLTLLDLLQDKSVFTASWAITSLCIFGRKYPNRRELFLQKIVVLQSHQSVAIRSKVRKAVELLSNENINFPKGWIKSKHINSIKGNSETQGKKSG